MRLLPLLLTSLLLTAGSASAQQRLLYTSADLPGTLSAKPLKSIRTGIGRFLTVRYQDGTEERVPKTSIWGYVDKKNRTFRRLKHRFLEVNKIGDLVEYVSHDMEPIGANGETMSVTNYYFSKTLDSAVYANRKKALRMPAEVENP
ncbi:MAG: hypothetical protein H7Y12_09960 [Sphingobacteriaceae bacterium]|nr:hypothetical protein [Cytophagaceae bacterium]